MEVKIIPAIICLLIFGLFAAPILTHILNVGNIVGMLISGILTLIFIFWKPFRKLVSAIWDKPVGKVFICIFSAIVCICIVLSVIISVLMAREIHDPPKDENTTLIVLGCKVKNGRPCLMLKRRLDAAYDYLSQHDSVNVIVSGGKGDDEAISEAQCMMEYLTEMGISRERIFMEDKSVNTVENLKFSKKIAENEGLPQQFTLVTDGFHQYRAEMLAEKIDMHPNNISGYTSWYIVPTYWVREWLGIAYYKVFG